MNYWWIVASENTSDGGWHWDNFFDHSFKKGDVSPWGGADWIRSTSSHKKIKNMRKGDIVVAHQGGEGVLGLIYLADDGKWNKHENQYDSFVLKTSPIVYFDNPIPFKLIKELPDAAQHFEFVKFHQGTVFTMTSEGFKMLTDLAAELNPSQIKEMESFLAKGGIKRRILTQEDVIASSIVEPPKRVKGEITRIVRDTAKTKKLKKLYECRCQVCDERIEIAHEKYYAEVHHIRPLGSGHDGLDVEENMIVVCPTHHAYFDFGVPRFLSESEIQIGNKTFTLKCKHKISQSNIDYHNREVFGINL